MKNVILYAITILAATIWAGETCQGAEATPNPPYSCQQTGYVCNLGFDVNGEDNVMFFHLGSDTTCTTLLTSRLAYKKNITNGIDSTAWFFLIENQENKGPLSLTLAGSLSMLAVNNATPVEIIYKKNENIDEAFGRIKLLSIRLFQTPIGQ